MTGAVRAVFACGCRSMGYPLPVPTGVGASLPAPPAGVYVTGERSAMGVPELVEPA